MDIYIPKNINDAVKKLSSAAGKWHALSGGVEINTALRGKYKNLVDLTFLDMNYIKNNKSGMLIGAATTLEEIVDSAAVKKFDGGMLHSAAKRIAFPPIRNMATIGGYIASSVPSADLYPPLLVLNAKLLIAGKKSRTVLLRKFFIGPRKNILKNGEFIREIFIPKPESGWRFGFKKIGRTGVDIALVNAACGVKITKGKISDILVYMGAVGPFPVRTLAFENFIRGEKRSPALLKKASEKIRSDISCIEDIRCSEYYRNKIAAVIVERLVSKLIR